MGGRRRSRKSKRRRHHKSRKPKVRVSVGEPDNSSGVMTVVIFGGFAFGLVCICLLLAWLGGAFTSSAPNRPAGYYQPAQQQYTPASPGETPAPAAEAPHEDLPGDGTGYSHGSWSNRSIEANEAKLKKIHDKVMALPIARASYASIKVDLEWIKSESIWKLPRSLHKGEKKLWRDGNRRQVCTAVQYHASSMANRQYKSIEDIDRVLWLNKYKGAHPLIMEIW